MDGLYQSPTYAYLPQNNDYHSPPNMYHRPSHTFNDRPFHMPPMDDSHHHSSDSTDSYWHSSNSLHHGSHPMHHNPYQTPSSYSCYGPSNPSSNMNMPSSKPKITTNVWDDEATLCFQVDAKGICVARRQDNDMINGTKLLNVVGMSRGKRDGILKNEKGRVVVKVGAMHLKGVWIPFQRARELAAKFKILDVLFPLFTDEPSMYLPSSSGAEQHNSNDVIPSIGTVSNKCNMVSSPLPAFSHRSDDYHNNIGLPNWDRPYHHGSSFISHHPSSSSSHYEDLQQGQGLHRTNLPDLSNGGSPIPRSMNQHHPHTEQNEMYLLNNNNSSNYNNNSSSGHYDYYHRQFSHPANNRGSFSSVSSHHSYLYPSTSLHHEDNDTSKASSVATPTSYNLDNSTATTTIQNSNNHNNTHHSSSRFCQEKSIYSTTASPYTKLSPYTATQETSSSTNNDTSAATIENNNNNNNKYEASIIHRTGSAGSTTPSSWFSPETPTAVLFQQKDKDESTATLANSKKRKHSLSMDANNSKTPSIVSPSSPALRATRRLKVVQPED